MKGDAVVFHTRHWGISAIFEEFGLGILRKTDYGIPLETAS